MNQEERLNVFAKCYVSMAEVDYDLRMWTLETVLQKARVDADPILRRSGMHTQSMSSDRLDTRSVEVLSRTRDVLEHFLQ